jgi:hypothetical protein
MLAEAILGEQVLGHQVSIGHDELAAPVVFCGRIVVIYFKTQNLRAMFARSTFGRIERSRPDILPRLEAVT